MKFGSSCVNITVASGNRSIRYDGMNHIPLEFQMKMNEIQLYFIGNHVSLILISIKSNCNAAYSWKYSGNFTFPLFVNANHELQSKKSCRIID